MTFRSGALLLIAAFSVTLAASWWKQRVQYGPTSSDSIPQQSPLTIESGPQPIVPSRTAMPLSSPFRNPPSANENAVRLSADHLVNSDAMDTDTNAGHTTPQEEVPVTFKMRQDPSQPAPTAILKNQLSESISVSVTASDDVSGNTSSVQVTIEPNRNTNLTEAGLAVASHDRIKIESPPYRPQEFEAP